MSFLIADNKSARAWAIEKGTLFFYDGGPARAGQVVAALEKEPNQIQDEFGNEQIVVACWNLGLMCFDLHKEKMVWKRSDLPRVARICYSAAMKTYFIRSEDTFGTFCFNSSGEQVEIRSEYQVLGAFNGGQHLLTETAQGIWSVMLANGSVISSPGQNIQEPVLAISGNDQLVAFGPRGGNIEIYELRRGKCIFRVKRENWFNVPSIVQTKDPLKFRALVSDWNKKAVGAVIEVDVREQHYSLVKASEQWNWDARLLDYGEAVLRYFDEGPNRFVVTRL
jgi:hypothetical protein